MVKDELNDVTSTFTDFYIPQKFSECVSSILGNKRGIFLLWGLIDEILLIMSMYPELYLSYRTIFLSIVKRALAKRGCSTVGGELDAFWVGSEFPMNFENIIIAGIWQ